MICCQPARYSKNNCCRARYPDALVHSFPKTTLKEFCNQKVRHLSVGKNTGLSISFYWLCFVTHLITWFAGIPLLFSSAILWVGSALIFRMLIVTLTVHQAAERFGQKFESWAVPLLDFLFCDLLYFNCPGGVLTKRSDGRAEQAVFR